MKKTAAPKVSREPVWARAWRMSRKRVHVEVRIPTGAVVKVYDGKDHTLHIIIQEPQ